MTTRVVVHINQLVLHENNGFMSEAFAESLKREIARRIGDGMSASDIALKLQGNAPNALHGRASGQRKLTQHGQRSTERLVATEIAGRLLK